MPQVVEKPEYSIESWELMEIYHWLHTQEVRGSSPCAPTIFNNLRESLAFKRIIIPYQNPTEHELVRGLEPV